MNQGVLPQRGNLAESASELKSDPLAVRRARQIDQEEFRRDSERALKRALEFSRQKRRDERARIMGMDLTPTAQKHVAVVLQRLGKQARAIEYQGVWMTAAAWAAHLNVKLPAFRRRIRIFGVETAIQMGGTLPRGWKWGHDIPAPGVVPNLRPIEGTGAPSHARESVQKDFSEKAVIE